MKTRNGAAAGRGRHPPVQQQQKQQRYLTALPAQLEAAAAAASSSDDEGDESSSSDGSLSDHSTGSGLKHNDGEAGEAQHDALGEQRQNLQEGSSSDSEPARMQQRKRKCTTAESSRAAGGSSGSKCRRAAQTAAPAVTAAAEAEALQSQRKLPRLLAVEQPGGIMLVDGMAAKIRLQKDKRYVVGGFNVPVDFIAQSFPSLLQQQQRQAVQLVITVDDADGTPAAAAGTSQLPTAAINKQSYTNGTNYFRLRVDGADGVLRRYIGHTVTAISCVKGSTQLTLHLQSPAAAAALELEAEAAEVAAAAAEADPALWSKHEVAGRSGIRCHAPNLLYASVPHSLLSSAFGDAWQQHGFKVQLSLHLDGACIAGGPSARKQVILSKSTRCYRGFLPKAFTAQLPVAGCRLTVIKAAAPNYMQVHVASDTGAAAPATPATAAATHDAAAATPAAAAATPAVAEQPSK